MKILHTSDWHLGHRLHEFAQQEEQALFLKWLEQYIIDEGIELLLISGDVFDSGTPSTQSLKMYYDFLVRLTLTQCKHIVVTGGNHDSPGTLNAPKALLDALSIKVVGKSTGTIEDEVFHLKTETEDIIIAAVPYLRDQDIRRAVSGETFDEITERYKFALTHHYTKVADYCNTLKNENTPVIAMGHLFAIGGSISDSEQNIYVGNLGHIGAEDFPETFDYIALGHLHRPQMVGGNDRIRYSGSPYALSFSERGQEKQVIQIETRASEITSLKNIGIPQFRDLIRLSGTLEYCLEELPKIKRSAFDLKAWVEIVLDQKSNHNMANAELQKAVEGLDLELLKVSLKSIQNTLGLEALLKNTKDIKTLSPVEVFKLKCKEQEFDIEKHQDIMDAFNEVLHIARKN